MLARFGIVYTFYLFHLLVHSNDIEEKENTFKQGNIICTIESGYASGEYDKEIGIESSAEKCFLSVRKKRKNANGMTWEKITHKCYAEFKANRTDKNCLSCQSCIFEESEQDGDSSIANSENRENNELPNADFDGQKSNGSKAWLRIYKKLKSTPFKGIADSDNIVDRGSTPSDDGDEDSADSIMHFVIPSVIIIIVLMILLVVVMLFYNRKKRIATDKIYTQSPSINDPEKSLIDDNKRFDPSIDVKRQVSLLTYDTKREIPRTMFNITKQIGSGNFGTVSKGEITGLYSSNSKTTVAIKSTKGPAEGTELRDFLQEIKIMSYTKAHLNLVNMIGSCSSDIEHGKEMWLILEFCNVGDLKSFLVENKKSIMNGTLNNDMNDRCLIQWAYDIGKGMEFLFKQKIMHGDLAARNVMLNENPVQSGRHVAMIADFGLSKRFYSNLEYEKQSRVAVPWKWMAYEFLTCDYFTLNSDVWSFGIVLWEIFSLGKTPFGHQEFNDVVSQLEDGYRLPCPSEVKDITDWDPVAVYENVTSLCFKEDPKERGTFCNVIDAIESHLSAEELSFYAKMEEKYKTERSDYYFQFRNRKI